MVRKDSNHNILELVRENISKHRLFNGKEKNIIVGFSGGADSVCLLFILKKLKEEGFFPCTDIIAAHLNHGIRGEEALRDEDFVRDFCQKNGIKLFAERLDVPFLAKDSGESEESAGRRLRYDFFRRILEKEGGGIIATAHHKNDLAETVLMNISRGTGLTGLTGIRWVNGDLVRPLLCLTRKQIEQYLKDEGLDHVDDSTNDQDIYTRNYMRNKIIPLIEDNINKGLIQHIYNLSEIASGADIYLEKEAGRLLEKCTRSEGKISVTCSEISEYERIIREYLFRRIFREISGSLTDLSSERIQSIDSLLTDVSSGGRRGKIIELVRGIRVLSHSDKIIFQKDDDTGEEPVAGELYIPLFDDEVRRDLQSGREAELVSGDITLKMVLTENFEKNSDSDYTKYFDYDKINDTACLRYVRADDFMSVAEDGAKHSLKKEMKNRKIPAGERDRVLVIARGRECLWAVGIRRSMSALAKEGHKILKITVSLSKDRLSR